MRKNLHICNFCSIFAAGIEMSNNLHIMKHTFLWVAALLLTFSASMSAGNKKQAADENLSKGQYVRCIAFYNLENLFDTIHDEGKNDYEYLPDGGMKWTSMKYENKIKRMGYAVAQLGTE